MLGIPSAARSAALCSTPSTRGRGRRGPVLAQAFAEAHDPDPMLDEALRESTSKRTTIPTPLRSSIAGPPMPDHPRPPLWHAAAHRRCNADPQVIIDDYRQALRRDPDNAEALSASPLNWSRHTKMARPPTPTPPTLPSARRPGRAPRRRAQCGPVGRRCRRSPPPRPGPGTRPRNAAAHREHAEIDRRHGERGLSRPPRPGRRADPVRASRPVPCALDLERLGRHAEAVAAYRTFTRLQQGHRELEDLQERLAESPKDPHLQSQIARWMFSNGYDAEAVQWSRKILTDTPGHPETCLLLADYYHRLGQPERANLYRQQVSTAP